MWPMVMKSSAVMSLCVIVYMRGRKAEDECLCVVVSTTVRRDGQNWDGLPRPATCDGRR